MHNIHYDYARLEVFQREAGMRTAQRNGTAFEPRPERAWSWPLARRRKASPATPGLAAPAPSASVGTPGNQPTAHASGG